MDYGAIDAFPNPGYGAATGIVTTRPGNVTTRPGKYRTIA
jgi:hypothetical protein